MPDRTNPFVFVVGCPRSGTTLLQRMLDAHPDLAVCNDSHFIPRALEKTDRSLVAPATGGAAVPLTPALLDGVVGYHRFRRIGIDEARVRELADGCEDYRDLVARIYDEMGARRGKRLSGEKTPDYVRKLPLLHGLFPRARMLHIVRDGRDVALSVLDWAHENKGPGKLGLWKTQPLAVCALWWKWQVASGREAARTLPDDVYQEVLYEKLVADPEGGLEAMADFLGIVNAPEMARFHVGKTRDDPTLDAKKAWRPATKGLRDWRRDMSEADVALFELLAGDLLTELGYASGTVTPTDEVRAVARECLAWWNENHRPTAGRVKKETA